MDTHSKKKTAKLHDVEVSHVSLVDRPANMTPFKFVKNEDKPTSKGDITMKLKSMFGKQAAIVVSVFAKTAARANSLGAILIEGSLTPVLEEGGVFVVRKEGSPIEDSETIVHMGDELGVAYGVTNLTDLRKRFALYETAGDTFDAALKQENFVPGIMIGLDALHTVIRNTAFADETETVEQFKTGVAKAVSDFGQYVDDLITSLPEAAFKFEKALVAYSPNDMSGHARPTDGFNASVYDALFPQLDAEPADTTPAVDAAPATPATPPPPAPDVSVAPVAPVADTTPPTPDVDAAVAPVAADVTVEPSQVATPASTASDVAIEPSANADDATETVDANAGVSPPAAVEPEPAPANLQELPKDVAPTPSKEDVVATAMEALTKQLSGQIGGIAEAVSKLTGRMDKADATVATLTKSVTGTVVGNPEADDITNVVDLKKDNSSGEPPLMDTAYAKRG